MAHRSFTITNFADTTYRPLYDVIIAKGVAVVPTDGLFPSLVNFLSIRTNSGGTLSIGDVFAPASGGYANAIGQTYSRVSIRNTIDLREYLVSGNAVVFNVDVEDQ